MPGFKMAVASFFHFHPLLRHPMLIVLGPNPVSLYPHMAMTLPPPITGRPKVAGTRCWHIHAPWRRRGADIDVLPTYAAAGSAIPPIVIKPHSYKFCNNMAVFLLSVAVRAKKTPSLFDLTFADSSQPTFIRSKNVFETRCVGFLGQNICPGEEIH